MKNVMKHTALLLLLCSSAISYGQWEQSVGSENLDVQSVMSTGIYDFFGGATGAYRSADESATYTFSNEGNDAVGPTRGLASDGTYVYACTSQGVFRSSNDGVTWEGMSNGIPQLLCHGIISAGDYIFLSTLSGVFKSADQGESWSDAGMADIDCRSICSTEGAVLFVGTQGSGVYKSTDNGDSWTAVNTGLTSTSFRAIQAQGSTVFAGGQIGTGVYRSLDQGDSWTLLTNGIASSSYRGFASNGDIVVAGSASAGVFYSLDNGDSWAEINEGLLDLNVFDLDLSDNYIIAGTHSQGVFRFALSEVLSDVDEAGDGLETSNGVVKSLLKIVDISGREVLPAPHALQFHIFDDGSVEKKIIID
jgi:hypothetical protein